jgi:hypothetical protein
LHSAGGVQTVSTRHVSHLLAYCTCPGWLWGWGIWWNEQGKPKYSEKTCPDATLSTTNPTWPDPGLNPGRRGGKPLQLWRGRTRWGNGKRESFFALHDVTLYIELPLQNQLSQRHIDTARNQQGIQTYEYNKQQENCIIQKIQEIILQILFKHLLFHYISLWLGNLH